jgi:DNA-binding protein YbaB
MLDKLKQLSQLKAMQDAMKAEKFEAEKNGVKVVVNGNLMVEEVFLNSDLPTEILNQLAKECTNEAIAKAQQAMAQKISGMGFGI